MRRFAALIGMALVVSGAPSPAQAPPAAVTADPELTKVYEAAFRTAFRDKFISQCVASAVKPRAAGFDVTPTCTCGADRLLASNTVDQLSKMDRSDPVILAAAKQCAASSPPVKG